MLTGGFIQSINSFSSSGRIDQDIYQQYLSWRWGTWQNRQERALFQANIRTANKKPYY